MQKTKRVALLIGNSHYSELSDLKNPVHDIELVANSLKSVGYDVFVVPDADIERMLELCVQFAERAKLLPSKAEIVLYYAGHAIQHMGENYLLPVSMREKDVQWLERSAVSLTWLQGKLVVPGVQHTRMIFVDGCRNYPFFSQVRGGYRGLAFPSSPPNTLIAFSTSPGQVALDGLGRHSPYAASLSENIGKYGEPIEIMLRRVRNDVHVVTGGAQVPWDHSALMNEVVFEKAQVAQDAPTSAQAMRGVREHGLGRVVPDFAREGHLIHKLKAKDSTGRWAYYFVHVEENREQDFLAAIASKGVIDLEDFGTVVASSYGEKPSDEVIDFLRETYGFDLPYSEKQPAQDFSQLAADTGTAPRSTALSRLASFIRRRL
ncbi:MAG: caspase family protein [Paracoccaceae bacterium]|nr:caspase family protein [Paracoccaceae bacterium]